MEAVAVAIGQGGYEWQSAPAFIVGAGLRPPRCAGAAVAYSDVQASALLLHVQAERGVGMLDRIGYQLGDDDRGGL
jgi:hypothetical protein